MSSGPYNTNDALNNESSIQINDSHNLIFKLYASLLTNNAVQNGLRQITKISQPLIGKFDDNLVKITSNVSKWVSHENIYNQLANIWLSRNFPFTATVTSFEDFTSEFVSISKTNRRPQAESASRNFYNFACEAWKALEDPTIDDIKNAILVSAARAVSKTYHFEDESLANALYNMLRMLIEKRKELVSGESYINLVKVSLGDEYWSRNQQVIKAACIEYYAFAKRFILIDFPLVTNNKDVLKLILHFVQDNSFYYGDSTLNFIEKRLDFFLKLLGKEVDQEMEDNTLAEKAQRIFRKIFLLSLHPFKRMEDVFHQVQNTKTYATMDNILHINDRVDDAIFLTAWGFNLLKENILEPSLNTFKVVTNKAKNQVTIVMHGLDTKIIKRKYHKLLAKYEILQHCAVSVADETLKLIFDKQALAGLGENGKRELMRFYNEVKTMETERIKNISLEYYAKILKKAQRKYHNSQRSIYYKKRELGEQETAFAIRPAKDAEVDEYDNQSHVHNVAGRETIEAIALAQN